MTKQRLMRCESQNLTCFNLDFRPFKNQHAMQLEYTKTLCKALPNVVLPSTTKHTVFKAQPAFLASLFKVRRIKNDKAKNTVDKRQSTKIHSHVRVDLQ